jgi:Molybdopterin converting factor, small subunit
MKVNLLAFGIAKDIIGSRSSALECGEHSSIAMIKEELVNRYPAFSELRQFSIAVDESYQEDDFVIQEGQQLAIIPPVSGG